MDASSSKDSRKRPRTDENERSTEDIHEALRDNWVLRNPISRFQDDFNEFLHNPPSFHGQETENPFSIGLDEISESPASNGDADPSSHLVEEVGLLNRRVRIGDPTIRDKWKWMRCGNHRTKGNPYPRYYYRCTMSRDCPVRKKVQKCAENSSYRTIIYEGNHNHPLPPDAMAMWETTIASSTMLPSDSIPGISAATSCPIITLGQTQDPPSTQPLFLGPFEPLPSTEAAPTMLQIFGSPLRNEAAAPKTLNETITMAPTCVTNSITATSSINGDVNQSNVADDPRIMPGK